jgi:PAS domain S-box-containing protein
MDSGQASLLSCGTSPRLSTQQALLSATILLVADEAIIARDIQKTLQELGYLVPPAVASGEQALEAVTAYRPDLGLMDIRLQGDMDGIETAALIGKKHRTPVVYLTSHSDDETLGQAKFAGAYGYLLKPFQDRDLRVAIEVALQKRKLELHLFERERWFATTLRSIGDAVVATDVEQRVTFMNPVAERVTGWTADEAACKQLSEVVRLIDPKAVTPMASPLQHHLHEEFVVEHEGFLNDLPKAILASKTGEQRIITNSAAPIVDDAGRTLGGVIVFRDVTEEHRLQSRLARGRVLIIDDEPAIGRVMCRVLQKEHDVFVLTDARDALPRIAAGERFNVVLCDLMMPGITGMDFFDALRESAPEVARRVVFVTGGAFTVRAEEFLRVTTNATVAKPVDPTALRRIVADYVGSEPQEEGRP